MSGYEEQQGPIDLRDVLRVLRRRKWWIGACSILVGGAAYTASSLQTPVYSARSEVLLSSRTAAATGAPAGDTPLELVLMGSNSVRDAIADHLGWSPTVSIGAGSVEGIAVVSATSSEPTEAARHANSFADAYVEVRRQIQIDELTALTGDLQTEIARLDLQLADIQVDLAALPAGDAQSLALEGERQRLLGQRLAYAAEIQHTRFSGTQLASSGASVISPAIAPSTPIGPTPRRDGAAGAVAGLVLGLGAAFLIHRLDDRLQSSEELEHLTAAPVIGLIPPITEGMLGGRQRLVMTDAHSAGAEAFRSLRTAIQFLGLERKLQVILVTSANAGEGKTATVANLGAALADAGQRVVVVGADLRHPKIGRYFGSEEEVGYTSVLLGTAPLEKALRPIEAHPGLVMLGAGPTAPNPSELLGHDASAELFAKLRSFFDVVLVDSPPVLPVSDALVLSRHADATILVAQAHRTTQRSLRRAIAMLRQVGSPVVGAVLSRADAEGLYGYGYGYGPTAVKGDRRRRSSMYPFAGGRLIRR